jgi:hypothetical protein
MTRPKTMVLLVLIALCSLCGPVLPLQAAQPVLQEDKEWSLLAGYGFQHQQWASQVGGEDVELALVYPTRSLLSSALGPCTLNLRLQAVLGTRTNGGRGIFAGAGPVIRVYWATGINAVPYLHLGVGALYTDMDLQGMGTRANFFDEGGAGLSVRVGTGLAVSGEYRIMHVSNADLSRDNAGLNNHLVLLGASYAF